VDHLATLAPSIDTLIIRLNPKYPLRLDDLRSYFIEPDLLRRFLLTLDSGRKLSLYATPELVEGGDPRYFTALAAHPALDSLALRGPAQASDAINPSAGEASFYALRGVVVPRPLPPLRYLVLDNLDCIWKGAAALVMATGNSLPSLHLRSTLGPDSVVDQAYARYIARHVVSLEALYLDDCTYHIGILSIFAACTSVRRIYINNRSFQTGYLDALDNIILRRLSLSDLELGHDCVSPTRKAHTEAFP
jgi:hypothetical protein